MREKKIAISLVIAVLVLSTVIGVTIWIVTKNKKPRINNVNNTNSVNTNNQIEEPPVEDENIEKERTIKEKYENAIYKIDLYTDGTATAKIKSDVELWSDLDESANADYKEEKNKLKSILTQGRQIDSNSKKIQKIYVSRYIGDIKENFNYGKAVIKCEENVYYLLDLVSDSKIRIDEDWSKKCSNISDEKIQKYLQEECFKALVEKQNAKIEESYQGDSTDKKYKYIISFEENNFLEIYIYINETNELSFYGIAEVTPEVAAGTTYYQFSLARPYGNNANSGSINVNIKQSNVEADDQKTNEKKISIQIQDLSPDSSVNYSTNGYVDLTL